jgi:CRP/FNR family transcriptional regulator, cyclic AMP receptor protein
MARGRNSYLEHLAKVPLFSSLSKRDLQRLAKVATEMPVKAGRQLVEQDRTGHEAFVIVDGQAVVRRNGRKVTTLGAGDFFGEMSLLDRGPRSATVEAVTDMTVLVIAQREFGALIDEVPGLAHKLLNSMAARLRETDARAYTH